MNPPCASLLPMRLVASFVPCTHTHEPVCGIKEAVAAGKIAASRYESYTTILNELKELKEKEGRK